MKLSPDCGIPFKAWTTVVIILEILVSTAVAVLAGWLFCFKVTSNFQFIQVPSRIANYVESNHKFDALVTSWILVILLCLCALRIFSLIILGFGVKKSSAEVSKIWIPFKAIAVFISSFVFTASLTVGILVKITAVISLLGDLLTAYYIRVLYPELEKMRKFIIVVHDEKQPEASA